MLIFIDGDNPVDLLASARCLRSLQVAGWGDTTIMVDTLMVTLPHLDTLYRYGVSVPQESVPKVSVPKVYVPKENFPMSFDTQTKDTQTTVPKVSVPKEKVPKENFPEENVPMCF